MLKDNFQGNLLNLFCISLCIANPPNTFTIICKKIVISSSSFCGGTITIRTIMMLTLMLILKVCLVSFGVLKVTICQFVAPAVTSS